MSVYFLYCDPVDFRIAFTSAIGSTGNVLAKRRKKVKKIPSVPIKIPISTQLG
jgi:hypothetical protein